jgi:cytochrome c2
MVAVSDVLVVVEIKTATAECRHSLGRTWRLRRLAASFLLVLAACSPDAGRQAYVDSGCPLCHASTLDGTRLGPPLSDVRSSWNREELEVFLKDPPGFRASSERLEVLGMQYPAPMPALRLPEETLQELIVYLLEQE